MTRGNPRSLRPTHVHAAIDEAAALPSEDAANAVSMEGVSDEVIAREQDAIDRRFREARTLENQNDIDGAIAVYRELLLEKPSDIRFRNNLGCLYEKRGAGLL